MMAPKVLAVIIPVSILIKVSDFSNDDFDSESHNPSLAILP
jgi:hypothetical protein